MLFQAHHSDECYDLGGEFGRHGRSRFDFHSVLSPLRKWLQRSARNALATGRKQTLTIGVRFWPGASLLDLVRTWVSYHPRSHLTDHRLRVESGYVFLALRHLMNLLAFCLSVRGFVSPPIGKALAFDGLEDRGGTLEVIDLKGFTVVPTEGELVDVAL